MRILSVAGVLLLSACGAGGSDATSKQGADGAGYRDYTVEPFTGIVAAGSYDVVVTQGPARAVRAEGSPNGIEQLRIRVRDGQLWIGQRSGVRLPALGKVVVYVTAPALARASVAGAGDLRIDKARGEAFTGSIGGSGDLKIDALEAKHAEFAIAGSGSITVAGKAEDASYSIAGSGSIDGKGLASRTSRVTVAGSGSTRAHATDSATISIMGSGNVEIAGGAKCSVSKMGSGTVACTA